LIHPSEFVKEDEEQMSVKRRQTNPLLHYFSDVLRVQLKKKNLGEDAFPLFENELRFWQKETSNFQQLKKFIKIMRIGIFLGHPAHFHLFRNTISFLMDKGHKVY